MRLVLIPFLMLIGSVANAGDARVSSDTFRMQFEERAWLPQFGVSLDPFECGQAPSETVTICASTLHVSAFGINIITRDTSKGSLQRVSLIMANPAEATGNAGAVMASYLLAVGRVVAILNPELPKEARGKLVVRITKAMKSSGNFKAGTWLYYTEVNALTVGVFVEPVR
jgi:hypothetical protein